METTKVMTLNSKLATIQTKLKAKKSRFNGFGKYNYRSAEDILEAVKPFLLELGVSVTINENLAEIAGLPVMESIATISDGNDSIQAYAIVGVDLNQKGMNVPQQFGSASSYGKKYSLGNLFLIDDTADSDATNDHKGNVAKPKLEGAALVKAKAFIKSGGSMEAIKKKYDIPADVLKNFIMKRKDELNKLREDKHYYGKFGKQFLSNSDISTLLTNPLSLGTPMENRPAFLIGGYFHTAILEPEKLKNFKIIEATTRNTKAYKEISNGEICLLQHEVDKTELLIDKMMSNEVCKSLIRGENVEYEVPGIAEIFGVNWKGKADIINHDEKLIIDLKTTADISKFKYSATKYNYNSQAYIYQKLFGYEMIFMVIDKNTHQIGIYDCSDQFLSYGEDKVQQAVEQYKLFFNNPDFEPDNYFINKTL